MKGKSTSMLLTGLAAGVLLGLVVLWGVSAYGKSDSSRAAVEVGKPAPDFELETLNGGKVRLSQYKGHPVLLNFWATWCNPCKEEMPLLESYTKKYAPELIVLGADNMEGEALVRPFVSENKISFPILMDKTGSLAATYQVRGFPTSFFIDADGILRSEHIGQVNEDLLVRYLDMIGLKE